MDAKAVTANQAAQTAASAALRQKPEAEAATAAAKPAGGKEAQAEAAPAGLTASQTVQDVKPTVNTSGQVIGSTINTTA
ncbi:hypothetical protein V8J88_17095 [Massilia sp. W12]|uniref:hypothetical protein n=1 Tax=Massilia sp. W12 TaxID=3126507 RepID=UPI0030D1286D